MKQMLSESGKIWCPCELMYVKSLMAQRHPRQLVSLHLREIDSNLCNQRKQAPCFMMAVLDCVWLLWSSLLIRTGTRMLLSPGTGDKRKLIDAHINTGCFCWGHQRASDASRRHSCHLQINNLKFILGNCNRSGGLGF